MLVVFRAVEFDPALAAAGANVNMAAPVQKANLTVVAGAVAVVKATLDDIQRMLKIEVVFVMADEVENALVSVAAVIVPPTV